MSRPAPPRPGPLGGGAVWAARAGWLALVVVAACAEPAPPTVTVRGVYVGPQLGGQAALVDHEAIPGRMDAMAMAFRVVEPDAFEGVAPGTPVRLTLDSASLAVVAAEALPEGTALDLAP